MGLCKTQPFKFVLIFKKKGVQMSTSKSRKKLKPEETIHGKKITRRRALKGLGRRESWIEFSKKAYEDFQKKPSKKKNDGMRHPVYRPGTSDKNMDRVIGPKPGAPLGGGKKRPKVYQTILEDL